MSWFDDERRGRAIELDCPQCGYRGGHKVTETDSTIYSWILLGMPYEITEGLGSYDSHRKRKRKCSSCRKEFETIETPSEYVNYFINKILTLSNEILTWNERYQKLSEQAVRTNRLNDDLIEVNKDLIKKQAQADEQQKLYKDELCVIKGKMQFLSGLGRELSEENIKRLSEKHASYQEELENVKSKLNSLSDSMTDLVGKIKLDDCVDENV